jgi:hypothetical protein
VVTVKNKTTKKGFAKERNFAKESNSGWHGSDNSMCFSVLKLCTVWYGASLGGPKLVNRYIL